jgi:hypothetical protein
VEKQAIMNKEELKPDILTHPNIPKPLHGVNPRLIMGQTKWDVIRKEVFRSSDYHCVACGVHESNAKKKQQLEAHEYYNIDYNEGRVEIVSIEPLCLYCHTFIHSGLLSISVTKKWRTQQVAVEILEHGFKILSDNKLQAFPFTLQLAKKFGAKTYKVKPYEPATSKIVQWGDWRLVWDGKEYSPKFATYEEWLSYHAFR